MTIPCEGCITFAICRSHALSYVSNINPDEIDNAVNHRTISLSNKCSVIKDFIYSDAGVYQQENKDGNVRFSNLLNVPRLNNIISYFLEYI
jgi:hypothetical protein